MESQRFMPNHASVQLEAALLQALAAAGMAGVEDGHIVLFRHPIDCGKQRNEVFLRVDIFLSVRRKQDVLASFQAKASTNIRWIYWWRYCRTVSRKKGTALLR